MVCYAGFGEFHFHCRICDSTWIAVLCGKNILISSFAYHKTRRAFVSKYELANAKIAIQRQKILEI